MGTQNGKAQKLLDPTSVPKTVSNIFRNEAIIAVLSASILSPILVPKITEIVSNLPPMISGHASLAAAIPAILIFRLAAGISNSYLRGALIGVAGSFVLTAILPAVTVFNSRVRS